MPALLAGPLGKILGIAVVVIAVFLYGEWHGRSVIQQRWDAAVTAQAIEAAENVIRAAENTARIESEFQKKLDAQKLRVKVVKQEVIKYVEGPSEKCLLTPEFERVFDGISRVYNAGTDTMPATGDSPGEFVDVPQARLTDAAVLRAYQGAIVELDGLWDTYHALKEWVRSSHQIAKEGAGR